MGIKVRIAENKRDFHTFLHFPYELHRQNPHWVPQPLISQKAILDRRRHPFYRTADAEFFLAERDGEVVGRIAAIHNRAHNDYHGDRTGFFGFFDCRDDDEAASALLDAAGAWCSERGLECIQGPMNPSTNYECAFLSEGFDGPPVIMMPWNPPYYLRLMEQAGMAAEKELLAYYVRSDLPIPEKLSRVAERTLAKEGVTIRTLDLSRFREELDKVFMVYNDAWTDNWGYVPMSREEIETMARELKPVFDPRLILIMEKDGDPVGFLFAMPDLNQVFARMGGRLFPFGWWHLLRGRRRTSIVRVLAMGFRKSYTNMGFAAVIYEKIFRQANTLGYAGAEISWILEDNEPMNRIAKLLDGDLYRRYRIYSRPV